MRGGWRPQPGMTPAAASTAGPTPGAGGAALAKPERSRLLRALWYIMRKTRTRSSLTGSNRQTLLRPPQPQRRLPRACGRYPGKHLSPTGQPAGSFRPCVRRPAHASVAAAKPKTECPPLLGDFPTDSPLFYNSPGTSPPTGIAEPFPTELSGVCSQFIGLSIG